MIPYIDKGHIFFFSPPSKIDDKVKYLTPYLQSKYSQTTYMKSLSHILKEKDISVNSIWTDYPLWTDAIRKRKIGNQNDCAHPSIIADMILEVMDKEDPKVFKGNELIDRKYLLKKNIDLNKYFYEEKYTKKLDNLFLSHLTKK
jgi:short-subunit dehydrogenase